MGFYLRVTLLCIMRHYEIQMKQNVTLKLNFCNIGQTIRKNKQRSAGGH